jgi:transcriptional regulator with XRE-family HTH domain
MTPSNLKEWRQKHGLTQRQFAKIIGQGSGSVIFKIENGLREISPAEKILFTNYMELYDLQPNPGDSETLFFSPAEMSKVVAMARTDGFMDPNLWLAARIKLFVKARALSRAYFF